METYPEWLRALGCRVVEAPAVRMPRYLRHRRLQDARELHEHVRAIQAAIARSVWGPSPQRVTFQYAPAYNATVRIT